MEQYRYVEVPEYSTIVTDLAESSTELSKTIDVAKEAADLHIEKHQRIKRAQELLEAISKEISSLMRLMPIKQPEKQKITKKPIEFSARPIKPVITESEKELLARSKRALQNLQSNLAELKAELGKK